MAKKRKMTKAVVKVPKGVTEVTDARVANKAIKVAKKAIEQRDEALKENERLKKALPQPLRMNQWNKPVYKVSPYPICGENEPKSKWTQFHDMHSGGSQKLAWAHVFIEAPMEEAAVIFQNRFGRNPNRVSCTCCGEDYSLTESDTLAEATAYERGCDIICIDTPDADDWHKETGTEVWVEFGDKSYNPYLSLTRYLNERNRPDIKKASDFDGEQGIFGGAILVIRKEEIKPEERIGELHEEGYVWRD